MKKKYMITLFAISLVISSVLFINASSVITIGGIESWRINTNGAMPVNIKDQTSPPFIVYATQIQGVRSITENISLNEYNISVNDSTGMIIGQYFAVANYDDSRVWLGEIIDINGNVVTLDTPADHNFYTNNSISLYTLRNLAVDGSVTPQIFSAPVLPGFNVDFEITRIIIHIEDDSAMDTQTFGGIPKLVKGLVVRRNNGFIQNIANFKSNGEIGELAYDSRYDERAPAGLFGYSSRLTFAGQEKMGVVIKLEPGDELQFIVQDDLSDLESLKIVVEGHVIYPGDE